MPESQSSFENNLSNLKAWMTRIKSTSGSLSTDDVLATLENMAIWAATLEAALTRACQLASSSESDREAIQLYQRLIEQATPNVRKLYDSL
ncbi:hypothetical protein ACF3DV_24425 [Chlorogloeopsis fritschii PCC 9212]|jgi:exonuclease VII small subunit|uniref:Uncharacterized protein n=1 Tax=Chlorogloeopsis fritschii PCC 6912 TaxID=211165 RepID=A0A3S5K2F8_CHLFR|nr:hypothetical protein [Chlorogloeopsis fritschii]RUR85791.1 hypothetical protein PCC6912_06160 [Chlorogloeopsis fritschii PCC 6912]